MSLLSIDVALGGLALALLGLCLGSLWTKRSRNRATAELEEECQELRQREIILQERLRHQGERLLAHEEQMRSINSEIGNEREKIAGLSEQLGRARGQLEEEVRLGKERAEWTSAQQNEWLLRFQSAGEALLETSRVKLTEQNQQHLSRWQESLRQDQSTHHERFDGLMRPLKECIDQLQRRREEEGSQWSQVYGALREQLQGQAENHFAIQRELQQLSHALRTPQGCGRWGELQLRRVVEIAGMLPYCDFDLQVTGPVDRGALRPDMVIRLPSDRQLIIDAKAPIQAYLEAQAAKTPEHRAAKLKEHAEIVRRHTSRLSQKEYWQGFKPTPEFTVLFLPGEAIFSAALEADPLLMEWTAAQNIILATPTTLIALLKAIAYGWRQHRSEENSRQIAQLGAQLYERLGKFSASLGELRHQLVRGVSSFNKAAGTWENRVLVSARKLHELAERGEGALQPIPTIDEDPKTLRSASQPIELAAKVPAIGDSHGPQSAGDSGS